MDEKLCVRMIGLLFLVGLMSCNNGSEAKTNKADTVTNVVSTDKKPAVQPGAEAQAVQKDSINKFDRKPITYDSAKKYIYLTFDDGPGHGTVACFDLCKELGIKSSFFMVGMHAGDEKLKDMVKNIRESYPQTILCNHSYTHARDRYIYFYQHPQMAFEDFLQAQQSLNVPYKIIRLPGNSAWVREGEVKSTHLVNPVCRLLDSAGYNVIGWDVEWSFNHKTADPVQSPEKMAEMVNYAFEKNNTHTKSHLVILTHDRMFRNPNYTDSLAKFITLMKQNPNYVFETIDNYPKLKFK